MAYWPPSLTVEGSFLMRSGTGRDGPKVSAGNWVIAG
jgi:hypothetical protein